MQQPTHRAPARPLLPALLLLPLAAALPAAAQSTPRLVVSTTGNLTGGGGVPVADDSALMAVGDSASARNYFSPGHWQGVAGFVPGDVDGFARRPGFPPGSAQSMAFTLLSNEGGVLDGDVVGFGPGGDLLVLTPEADLLLALGVPDANIDLDAISYDDQSRLLFSLQSDLPGTALGNLLDGDILRLETDGTATLLFTEDAVQSRFTQATGLTDAIGDVQGLEWFVGEFWIAPQSPSSHDGAVIRLNGTPRVIAEEADLGLGGAELDALAFMNHGDEIPVFALSPEEAAPGEVLHVECQASSGGLVVVLMSGGAGFVPVPQVGGFGAWYLDPLDPWLNSGLMSMLTLVRMGSDGRREVDWALPAAPVAGSGFAGETGWSFQVFDLMTSELSAPFRVRAL